MISLARPANLECQGSLRLFEQLVVPSQKRELFQFMGALLSAFRASASHQIGHSKDLVSLYIGGYQ